LRQRYGAPRLVDPPSKAADRVPMFRGDADRAQYRAGSSVPSGERCFVAGMRRLAGHQIPESGGDTLARYCEARAMGPRQSSSPVRAVPARMSWRGQIYKWSSRRDPSVLISFTALTERLLET
jgi:hypothetical protein